MSVADYIDRTAKRCGFKRAYFIEKNMPTEPSNVEVVVFYGDIKHLVVLSSLLLKEYKKKNPDKYVILCSWPGFQSLFPYIDEYWYIDDENLTKTIALEINKLYNNSTTVTNITMSLAESISILTSRDLAKYYTDGFTDIYWKDFKEINRFLPEVPSANLISTDFKIQFERNVGKKVIIYPSRKMSSWQQGKSVFLPISKDFWICLINELIKNGYFPIVYQNWFTYDLSVDFADKCMYLVAKNVNDVLAAMRYTGLVLDIHNGISRLASLARCPFISVTERQIFIKNKEYEFDDLICSNLPKQYLFSFSTMLMAGNESDWEVSLLNRLMVKLGEFSSRDFSVLPSTNQSYETVSYDNIREIKNKRLGVSFIRTSRER